MSDYGYDFSCYLLSRLSEKTSLSSEVTHCRHLCLLVLAVARKFWISSLCRVPLPPRISGGPEGSSHMLADKCILVMWLSDHSFSPSCLMRITPSSDPTEPPSRGTVTTSAGNSLNSIVTFEGMGDLSVQSPRGVQITRSFCKMEGNELSMFALL